MRDGAASGTPLRRASGTYALHLRATREDVVEVGALGALTMRPGVYVYVGSALGPGGVRARVDRHAREHTATHWHVDYVRSATVLEGVWVTYNETRRECAWAAGVGSLPRATIPMRGVGASDCDCRTHLFWFSEKPSVSSFRDNLQSDGPGHGNVTQVNLP